MNPRFREQPVDPPDYEAERLKAEAEEAYYDHLDEEETARWKHEDWQSLQEDS